MNQITSRRSASRGFTLVETMVSIVVMLIAIMGLLAVVPFSDTNVQSNSLQVQAVSVAQRFLDDERNAKLHTIPMPTATSVPIDAGLTYTGNGASNTNYGNFSITPNGCATTFLTGSLLNGVNTWTCSVTVSWTISGVTHSEIVQSYVAE